uniref:Uncharacterized protein n=1 Tax=Megaselia scalaris TaxID=36166 RepID=T1GED6_MEGSC
MGISSGQRRWSLLGGEEPFYTIEQTTGNTIQKKLATGSMNRNMTVICGTELQVIELPRGNQK